MRWRAAAPTMNVMATHPNEPDAPQPGQPPHHHPVVPESNPSRLPVEPEFPAEWQPAEPEEPGARPTAT